MSLSTSSERKPTVLIADDDPNMAELIAAVLEDRGYMVDVARSGTEALHKLQEAGRSASQWDPLPFDVVVLDAMMPGTDGFQVCQRIKQDPILKHVPVIMLTALSSPGDKVAAVAYGADGYITKPFLPETLREEVEKVLGVGNAGE